MKRMAVLLLSLLFLPFTSVYALDESIKVDMHYIVVEPLEDGNLNLQHMANYSNMGGQEYAGEESHEGVISIQLPLGALNLEVSEDERLGMKVSNKGFSTTLPIPKAESQIISYSYQIPTGVPIVFPLDYPLEVLQVLVPEGKGSLQFSEAEISAPQQISIDSQTYWMYNVLNIKPGQEIKFSYLKDTQPVADVPIGGTDEKVQATTQTNGNSEQNNGSVTRTSPGFHNPGHIRLWNQSSLKKFDPHILMIVLGVILVSGVGYFAYFRWKNHMVDQRLSADRDESEFKQLLARQNAIMDKIIELEEQHAAGDLQEEQYSAKILAYKEHLVQVKQNLSRFVG